MQVFSATLVACAVVSVLLLPILRYAALVTDWMWVYGAACLAAVVAGQNAPHTRARVVGALLGGYVLLAVGIERAAWPLNWHNHYGLLLLPPLPWLTADLAWRVARRHAAAQTQSLQPVAHAFPSLARALGLAVLGGLGLLCVLVGSTFLRPAADGEHFLAVPPEASLVAGVRTAIWSYMRAQWVMDLPPDGVDAWLASLASASHGHVTVSAAAPGFPESFDGFGKGPFRRALGGYDIHPPLRGRVIRMGSAEGMRYVAVVDLDTGRVYVMEEQD